jgi:hypothetical protein
VWNNLMVAGGLFLLSLVPSEGEALRAGPRHPIEA